MDKDRLEHRIKERVVKALDLDIEPSDISTGTRATNWAADKGGCLSWRCTAPR